MAALIDTNSATARLITQAAPMSTAGEIDPPVHYSGWKDAVRLRILSARRALLRHPWARQVVESRTSRSPAVLEYTDFIGMFLAGGFSVDLTHHVMHALGSRMWRFAQELFDDAGSRGAEADVVPEVQAAIRRATQSFSAHGGQPCIAM